MNDDFLGNGFVQTIRPNGDDTVAWGTLGSGDNYEEVDEAQLDGDTSYTWSDTADALDIFEYSSVSGMSQVAGLVVFSVVSQGGSGDEYIQNIVKSGAAIINSETFAIGITTYQSKESYSAVDEDPGASAAWTQGSVNLASFGIKYI